MKKDNSVQNSGVYKRSAITQLLCDTAQEVILKYSS